jgi:hypothetical protein
MKGKHNSPKTEFKKGLTPWNKRVKGLQTHTEEYKMIRSESWKGSKNPNFVGAARSGKRRSEEAIKHVNEGRRRYFATHTRCQKKLGKSRVRQRSDIMPHTRRLFQKNIGEN